MGSQTDKKLPIIEFTDENLSPGTSSWTSTSHEIRCALEEYGCFAAVYNKVSSELREAMFNHAKELFELPMENKLRNVSDILGFGYGGNFPSMPLAEYFGIANGATAEATKNFAEQMWPNANVHKFCEETLSYSKLIAELDDAVTGMMLESYGLEKYYYPLIYSSMYLMRFVKYRTPKMNETSLGHQPHKDKSFMGIIDTNKVECLEIQTRDGNWMTFDDHPSCKTIVFIAGEPFTAWSNGRVYSPLHRVMMKGSEDKYTLSLFSFMRETLDVPEELVDEENPQQFKSFNNFEYLKYCATDGWKEINPIKAYCGV